MISRRRLLKGFGAFVLTGFATAGYGFGVEPLLRTRVTRYALTPPNWPPGLKLSIAVLADIHAGEPYMPASRIRSIADTANALNPDITLLLGDFTTGHKWQTRMVPADEWADALTVLKAPLGVHAVLGNHDWWDDFTAQQTGKGPTISHGALAKVGIRVYENDAVRLTKDNQPFWLAGLGDQIALLKGRRWNSRSLPRRRRSARHARQDHRSSAGHSPRARARHLSQGSGARGVDALRPYARRSSAPSRLFARRSLALRKPLCLRAHRRRRPQSDRLRRPRLLDLARAVRLSAGDRAHHLGSLTRDALA